MALGAMRGASCRMRSGARRTTAGTSGPGSIPMSGGEGVKGCGEVRWTDSQATNNRKAGRQAGRPEDQQKVFWREQSHLK